MWDLLLGADHYSWTSSEPQPMAGLYSWPRSKVIPKVKNGPVLVELLISKIREGLHNAMSALTTRGQHRDAFWVFLVAGRKKLQGAEEGTIPFPYTHHHHHHYRVPCLFLHFCKNTVGVRGFSDRGK